MSGSTFPVTAGSPVVEIGSSLIYFCCPPCGEYFEKNREAVLKKRGLTAG